MIILQTYKDKIIDVKRYCMEIVEIKKKIV